VRIQPLNKPQAKPKNLLHNGTFDDITGIPLSVEFKIAVTAGRDGLAVIWDLNE